MSKNVKTIGETVENSNSTTLSKEVIDSIGMGYLNATGEIKYSLKNDLMFHIVMNKSELALKGLICALKGLKPEDVKSVKVLNPIDYNNCIGKIIILDVKVELNNSEIIDVELQMYKDEDWEKRSLLYLCRSFDNIGKSENYEQIKPTLFVAITERKYMPSKYSPEFYSKYRLLNTNNHESYSSLLELNVLYLDQIELATKEDKDNKLDYWANLFKATTWEELKTIVKNDPCMEEVAKVMYSSNIIPEEKTILEAEQRFRLVSKGVYHSGYKSGYEEGVKDSLDIIADKENIISEKDKTIEDKDKQIDKLLKEIDALKRKK